MKDMKQKLIFFFISIILLSNIISLYSDEKQKYPKLIEELVMPSGFDNDYVQKIKIKEPVEFKKPLLRIMKFDIPKSFFEAIRKYDFRMEDALKSKIFETGRYNLLATDKDLQSVFKEQKKLGSDDFDDETNLEIGKLKVAGYILTGSVTNSYPDVKQMGGYFSLKVSVGASITITSITTGEVIYTKNIDAENEEKLFVTAEGMIIQGPRNLTNKPLNSIRATGKDIDLSPQYYKALDNAVSQVVYFIEEKFPVMGEVISVNGNYITTTISQNHGIKKDDYVFILRIGEELKDSSDKIIGFNKTMIGASQILSVESNMSTAKIIKLKSNMVKPQKNDIVISLPANAK